MLSKDIEIDYLIYLFCVECVSSFKGVFSESLCD